MAVIPLRLFEGAQVISILRAASSMAELRTFNP
jgi:hypothetical protein